MPYDVVFELPRPVDLAADRPGRKPVPSTLTWKILSFGYFDRVSKRYSVVSPASKSNASVAGNELSYPNIFPGVDARFEVGATRLKEAFVLSQKARDDLPDPQQYGILRSNAYLMVQLEFRLTPNSMNAYARPDAQTKTPIKQGNRFDYEGEDRIDFEDTNDNLHFFFPQDFAHAAADSANRTAVRKYFYFDHGVNYLLAGVPLAWLDAQPAGEVVIDPTTSVSASDDVWLEDTGNKNSHQFIIAGKSRTPTTDYPKKRTVIEFDVSSISSSANVINAVMKLYYYAAVRPTGSTDPWIDRWIQAHQLLVDWDEAQATKVKRLTSTNWNADWGAIDGTDADSTMESTVLFQEGETGTWKSWNLTNVTQDWVDGSATNYGVILWATNEDTDGYDLRFRSSEYSSDQPKLEVTYTEDPLKTVFILKDHLGSIRATVEEDGDVVGYTDYDPWGYLLAGRVLETGWSGGQNVAKNKFTGKEWDDDFGLNWSYFGARYYDPEIGRWRSLDPRADQYPGISAYVYALNNPLIFIDPDGREVRCATLEECERAALELNEIHGSETSITIVETQWEESASVWWNPFTWGKTKTVEGFKLSTGESDFDWSSTEYASALYDVINSTEIVFDFEFVPGDQVILPGFGKAGTAFNVGGGALISRPGGGKALISAEGNRLAEPTGVVIMHELVGHGHPAGGGNAQAVNRHYQTRLGYRLSGPRGLPHGGYHQRIGWTNTNLYQKRR